MPTLTTQTSFKLFTISSDSYPIGEVTEDIHATPVLQTGIVTL